jgi:hypothetical protein
MYNIGPIRVWFHIFILHDLPLHKFILGDLIGGIINHIERLTADTTKPNRCKINGVSSSHGWSYCLIISDFSDIIGVIMNVDTSY